jgi:hypothetical protein
LMLAEFERQVEELTPNRFRDRRITGGQALENAAQLSANVGHRIKSLLPESAGLIILYGPPGGGKTFVGLDWGACIATGRDYHGNPVKQGKVLYVAAEGQAGILRRLRGWRKHYGLPVKALTDFSVLPLPVQLDTEDLSLLLAAIRDLPDETPEVIFIDTLARSMTGDENNTRDMNAIVRALDQIREESGAQVVVVHHTGKDESRGARGAIALTGATDTMFKILRKNDGTVLLLCERQKDEELSPPMAFRSIVADTGLKNSHGEYLTTLVLEHDPDADLGEKKKTGGLKGAAKTALDALKTALDEQGEQPSDEVAGKMDVLLPGDRVVHEDAWREIAYKMGISSTEKGQRQAFWTARNKLVEAGKVGSWDGYYWQGATVRKRQET